MLELSTRPNEIVLTQGSDEWHSFRSKGIGASEAAIIMGSNPWSTITDLFNRKAGIIKMEDRKPNEAMQHGIDLEPYARKAFIAATGLKMQPKCFINPKYPWLRASLDGINEDGSIILEIKCPTKLAIHMKVVRGTVPSYYYPQLQHQLACCDAEFVCFWSYMKTMGGAMIEVTPNHKYIKELIKREKLFWKHVTSKVTPNPDDFTEYIAH